MTMIPMKALLPAVIAAGLLAGCSTDGPALEPIPGSITYGGQPSGKLTKSPVGSVLHNDFYDQSGQHLYETYVLQPDRSLKLTRREVVQDYPQ